MSLDARKRGKGRLGKRVSHRPATYPWTQWLKPGSVWRLVQGTDYRVGTGVMIRMVRNNASRMGVGVKVEVMDGGRGLRVSARAKVRGRV